MNKEFGQFYLNDFGELDCTAHSELWARRVYPEQLQVSFWTEDKNGNPIRKSIQELYEPEKIMYVTIDNENIIPCVFVSDEERYGSPICLLADPEDQENPSSIVDGVEYFATSVQMIPEPGDVVFFSYAAIVNFIKRGMFEHYVRGRKALFESEHKKNSNKPKKRIMVQKFIKDYFEPCGSTDYVKPKNGSGKFHKKYDLSLFKFFAQHGITEIHPLHGHEVPQIGFSETEQKWYGWSHRAIYGFGIGSEVKKGDCGYEYPGPKKAKTLEDAKKMAENFADSVS